MVKIKLENLWKVRDSFKKLYSSEMPVGVAFMAKKSYKTIADEIDSIINFRNDLIKKHSLLLQLGHQHL